MENPSEVMPLKELNQAKPVDCKTPTSQKTEDVKNSITPNSEENKTSVQQDGDEDVQKSINGGDSGYKCKASAGSGTPDRLKLPKPFKYAERYTSPTDHMMSPISKGLLARKTRRGGAPLPPSKIQSKIQELRSPNVELCLEQ